MRLSRFVHFIDGRILWHALRFTHLEIDDLQLRSDLTQAMKDKSRSVVLAENHELAFRHQGFLIDDGQDDELLSKAITTVSTPQIQSLFLITTTRCNLCCDYCLYGTENSQSLMGSSRVMTPSMAIDAVDLFATSVANNTKAEDYWQAITFYGGEPLTNLETMVAAVSHVRKLQAKGTLWLETELVVNTNGILVDDDFAAFATKERMEIQVSLDGFQPVHDQHRQTADGQGSFVQAVSAIKKLLSAGVQVRPMITLTEDNMSELSEFVTWMSTELGVTCYACNLLMSKTGNIRTGYGAKAARAMWETHERNQRYGIKDPSFIGQIKQFHGPDIARPSCGANGRKLTIFPEGAIHTCQALESSGVSLVGHVPEVDFEGNWQTWKKRSRFNNPHCLKCPALGVCGGGCLAGSYHAHSDINGQDPNHCQWIKALLIKWLIIG